MNKNVMAIIPARGGSKGVPGKNKALLAGYPLIAYSVVAGILSKHINRVIVSTDSEEIAEIAVRYGAEKPFLRPAEFARDNSPDDEFVLHALSWFTRHEGNQPDYLVHLRPTTPLRDPQIIDDGIKQLMENPTATSLRSAHEAPESPFKWFRRDDNGYFQSLIEKVSLVDINLPRQQYPTAYIPDGYVDVLRSEQAVKTGKIHGERILGFVSPFCQEVDAPEDFALLEYWLASHGSPLYDYLKLNFRREG